jgi:type I restriction enzyme R subunit
VLDFRNETDDIVKAFEPYYGRTVAPPTDPNLLFDTSRHLLDDFDVVEPSEVAAAVELLVTGSGPSAHAKVYAALDPAVERFSDLGDEDQLSFKDALDRHPMASFVKRQSARSQRQGGAMPCPRCRGRRF